MFNEKQTLDLYFSTFPMNVQETPNNESFCFREVKILLWEVYEPKCENWLKKQIGTKKLIGGEGDGAQRRHRGGQKSTSDALFQELPTLVLETRWLTS